MDTPNTNQTAGDFDEVVVKVKPGKDYSAELKTGKRLKLVLDQRNGRLWSIEDRPDYLADEEPEGRPDPNNPEWTWIYFTPRKDVVGTGHIRLITTTEYGPDGTGDFSKGQTSIVYLSVNTQGKSSKPKSFSRRLVERLTSFFSEFDNHRREVTVMRNFVITAIVLAVMALGVGLLAKSQVATNVVQKVQSTGKSACTFLQKHDIKKITASKRLARKVTIAKAGSYDLMYHLWRGLTLTQGVSIDGSEPKPQITEDALRQERMQLIRTRLPRMQANMAAILRMTDSEIVSTTGEQQKTWKTIQDQATIGATALSKISNTQDKELTTEQDKEEVDRIFGSQAMFYADAVYEMDQASLALSKLQK